MIQLRSIGHAHGLISLEQRPDSLPLNLDEILQQRSKRKNAFLVIKGLDDKIEVLGAVSVGNFESSLARAGEVEFVGAFLGVVDAGARFVAAWEFDLVVTAAKVANP